MKAAQLTGPETIELVDLPVPDCPVDGVLLQVRACGVCGSDLRRYKEGPAGGGITVPGHEFAGEVVAVGSEVIDYAVGDRLAVAPDVHCLKCWYCSVGLFNLCDDMTMIGITPGFMGGLAEYCVLPAHALAGGTIHKMPAALSWTQGALGEPLSSVQACHQDIGTRLGDTVLVMGAGPIGCLHTAIAHLRGARVILSEPNALRREMAAPLQAGPPARPLVSRMWWLRRGPSRTAWAPTAPSAPTPSPRPTSRPWRPCARRAPWSSSEACPRRRP